MNTLDFIRRHPLATYFALAFAIAWGGILYLVVPEALQGQASDSNDTLPVIIVMFAGPSIAGILLTAMLEGRAGLRALWGRWSHWRVGWRWYVVALAITPLLFGGVLMGLTMLSPVFTPGLFTASDKLTLLVLGLGITFLVGFFEEIGWTGFATPRLLQRHNVLAAGLIIGVPWGIWHFLPDWWGSSAVFGSLYAARFLVWWPQFAAFRILMTWVYRHTQSLWVGQLMHASFTGSQAVLGPMTLAILNAPTATPADSVLWNGVFAVALWLLAGAVLWAEARQQTRTPMRMQPTGA